ncbi:DUF6571 family protein [Actinomyces capricornis]|uniref:DUF6571 domain-containing protein n=1 Tax=Actinomyces capricornis TaxID=2755559 RepID=A0ABN6K261_9ACTO|nr:DUF6571 family protein [Actinomyces capricornis]BDA63692.1 hypothetical protein MANAM107_05260 [Actinomyces capricornis]
MTKLYMNPEKLAGKIEAMWALAMSATVAKSRIDDQSEQLHDPMKAVSIDVHLTSIQTAIDAVNARASDIAKCKNVIEDLNSNGVTVADSSGGITVEIPTEANVTSSETLSQWAQGATDAHDLKNLDNGGRLPSGRSYDDLVKSIEANKENTTYANGLVDTIGPENLIRISLDVRETFGANMRYFRKASVRPGSGSEIDKLLGVALSTASGTWSAEKSEIVANKIVSSVDEEGEWDRITILNAILGDHDANGDHVNDLKFGKDFLVSLGNGLEELPWETMATYSNIGVKSLAGKGNSDVVIGPHHLSGVLDAMGNNPDAALDFLAPEGSIPDGSRAGGNMNRMHELSERRWDKKGFAALTAAIASASAHRASDDSTMAARADDLAGHAVHYLVKNTEEGLYSDAAKARLGVLLANCAPEVESVLCGATASGVGPHPEQIPAASSDDFNTLIYRVIDNEDAAGTISAGIAQHARSVANADIAANAGNRAEQIDGINDAYVPAAEAIGALGGMADAKAGEARDDHAARTASAQTAIGVFTTVVTAGLTSAGGSAATFMRSPAGGAATSVATTLLSPVIADIMVPKTESPESKMMKSDADSALWAMAVQSAANSGDVTGDDGLISQEDLKKFSGEYSWIVRDADGTYRMDLSSADSDAYNKVRTWTRSMDGTPNEDIHEGLSNDFNGSYSRGEQRGYEISKEIER